MSSYDLEKVNTAIADTLSGNGSFDDLRRLQASKADILDRMHFDSIQTIKDEISALEGQRLVDYAAEKELQSKLEAAAFEVDKQAAVLQQSRENHGTLNGLIFLKKTALDVNREAIRDKKAELNSLIQNKINEVTND
jgi:hypothetical protein